MRIDDAILHILDSTASVPVLSREKLDLTHEKVYEYIERHIGRLLEDQSVKAGEFSEASTVKELVTKIDDDFIEGSIQIAENMYKLMLKYPEIPSGDLLIASLNIDEENYLAIIKFNYREGYTHYVDYGDNGTKNKIVVNRVMFPSEGQRNIEGALINLEDLSLKVFEKEYSIEGGKILYFSDIFLRCTTDLSIKESIKIIDKVAKDFAKEYYNDDFEKVSQIKEAIYENLDEGTIEVEEVAAAIFSTNPEIKKEYIETVMNAGVGQTVDLEGKRPEKRLGIHKFKTDSGIKLDIPIDIYKNNDIIEFFNNPDGTISIMIKNINNIKQGR